VRFIPLGSVTFVNNIPIDDNAFRPPTDAEIAAAEECLGISFHPDYRAFLKGGGDVGHSRLQLAVILPGAGHLDFSKLQKLRGHREAFPLS
jgi:hypothetical protein